MTQSTAGSAPKVLGRISQQLTIAKTLETDFAFDGRANDIAEEVERITPEGTKVVLECTEIPQCIDPAIALCREHGSLVWQGHYGSEPVSMHFIRPHGRRLRMFFPCDDGWQPWRRAVVKNMAMGAMYYASNSVRRSAHDISAHQ